MDFPTYSDTPISSIDQIHDNLKKTFATHVTHSVDYRVYNLKQLIWLIKDNKALFCEALRRDLDKGEMAVEFEELFPINNELELAVRKVEKWMKPESRAGDAILSYKLMNPQIRKQPKGVSLIIGPWNFPAQCVLIPLIGAISAGCPAVIKPSELSPATAALLANLIPKYLDPDAYSVICGAAETTTKLLEKQWGHVFFTGSGRVGKIVAEAAAKTLSPSTLELGGKSPVIVAEDADLKVICRRMLSIKQAGIGQICVAPDYILCVRSKLDELIATMKETLESYWPHSPHPRSFLKTRNTARLSTKAGFERQISFLEHAESEGSLVYKGEKDAESLRMGVSIVLLDQGKKGGGLREEEIFGPVLPIIPVQDVDEAIKYINDRPHPLALYACTSNKSIKKKIASETISGSLTFNDFGLATINRSLPFGGVGDSGWGSYHGEDGFNTFTHKRSVLSNSLLIEPLMHIRYPPSTALKMWISRLLFMVPINVSRPVSVEHEMWKRRRRAIVKYVGYTLVALGGTFFGLKKFGVESWPLKNA